MTKEFWISDPPIFFYGALKIMIFKVFFEKKSHFQKCCRNFFRNFCCHGGPLIPNCSDTKSWNDRTFLHGVTERFIIAKFAFLDLKVCLKNPLANWYFKVRLHMEQTKCHFWSKKVISHTILKML